MPRLARLKFSTIFNRTKTLSTLDTKIEQLNTVDRYILLLLGAKDFEAIPSRLHLQNEMHMLQNLFSDLAGEADFGQYPLEPRSEIVANRVKHMAASALIDTKDGRIELSPEGTNAFDVLKRNTDRNKVEKIEEFKELLNDLSRDEVLAFTYFSHPLQAGLERTSEEYVSLLPRRKALAISMYQKDKISAQKAAQISGECLEDFIIGLKARGR